MAGGAVAHPTATPAAEMKSPVRSFRIRAAILLARRHLCGGRWATGSPTAMAAYKPNFHIDN